VVLERHGDVGLLIVFQLYDSLSLSMGRLQGFLVVHKVYNKGSLCLLHYLCW
jgi:hypothetical protein